MAEESVLLLQRRASQPAWQSYQAARRALAAAVRCSVLVVEVEVLEETIEEQMVDLEVELILLDHLIQAALVILLQLIPHKEMMVEQEILQVAN